MGAMANVSRTDIPTVAILFVLAFIATLLLPGVVCMTRAIAPSVPRVVSGEQKEISGFAFGTGEGSDGRRAAAGSARRAIALPALVCRPQRGQPRSLLPAARVAARFA